MDAVGVRTNTHEVDGRVWKVLQFVIRADKETQRKLRNISGEDGQFYERGHIGYQEDMRRERIDEEWIEIENLDNEEIHDLYERDKGDADSRGLDYTAKGEVAVRVVKGSPLGYGYWQTVEKRGEAMARPRCGNSMALRKKFRDWEL